MIDEEFLILDDRSVSGILPKGGTILGTSRTNPYKKPSDIEKLRINFKKRNLKALITVGGEDTLGVANQLFQEGFPLEIGRAHV